MLPAPNSLLSRSHQFSLAIIQLVQLLPRTTTASIICNQLIRSGTSVGANLHEATSASSRKDFKRYHEIALKSANETRYWLLLLKDAGLLPASEKVQWSMDEADQLAKMIASGVIKLRKEVKG